MLKIGHRGAAGYAPENTLASFKKALELKVDMIEFDVRLTKRGNLVLVHDKRIKRIVLGQGKISNMTCDDLNLLKTETKITIPTLEQALDLIDRKTIVNVELKDKNSSKLCADIISRYKEKHGWQDNHFIISSYKLGELNEFNKRLPKIPLGLIRVIPLNLFRHTKKVPFKTLILHHRLVNPHIINKAHSKKLQVFVYTVNNKKDIERMKIFNVDGIISNFPDRI